MACSGNDPYRVEGGRVTVAGEPGWGVEIEPEWLARSAYQVSEAGMSQAARSPNHSLASRWPARLIMTNWAGRAALEQPDAVNQARIAAGSGPGCRSKPALAE